ncbi:8185_t:CDS:2, partial [Scutellospora calospora]
KHVPHIKFLGPRTKLHKEQMNKAPKPHPAAPKDSSLPSSSHNKSQELKTNNISYKQKHIIEYSDLPDKYKRRVLTLEEIETIE